MPETHYIEIDEEIIGAVGRLRKSVAAENVFVFPKRALILQSIINLKLLAREAEKLGKTIIVMSQDEQGMRLAEKAGLRIEEYHDAILREHRQESDARFTVRHGETIPTPEKPASEGLRRSTEIGSSSFYASGPNNPGPSVDSRPTAPLPSATVAEHRPSAPGSRPLRVRNMSPEPLTSLNSRRESQPVATPPLPMSVPTPMPTPVDRPQPRLVNGPMANNDVRKEKLRRLFQQPGNPGLAAIRPPEPPISEAKASSSSRGYESKSSNGKSWLWALASLCIVAGIVLGGYFFLRPEAIVSVEPQEATQMLKRSLVGMPETENAPTSVPTRVIEEEKTIRLSRPATGKDLGNAAKASGVITIMNNQSDATQSLVATTRFETSDGKIYRLVEGVTVPGTKDEGGKKVPGKIDARVMADAAGMGYNIASGTFRIPGFKGGPKYDTITAEVKTAFTGGGDGTGNEALSVSAADLDTAKTAAMEEAKKVVFSNLQSELQSGEAILEKSFQVALIGTPNAPAVGTVVASNFDYEARFQVQGFVLSESKLRSIIDGETIESAGVVLKPAQYEIGYGTVLSNFEAKRVDFTVESKVLFRAPIDSDTLKEKLLGLNEEGIRTFLAAHPEIKRLQVEFKPKIFIATIPDDPKRVIIRLETNTNE
ncbi:MAG: hypothetical protein ACEQSB_06035 [Undibacterium sp.]